MAAIGWALLGIVCIYLLVGQSTFQMYVAGLAIIYAISALGLDWIQGRAGQVSIGSAAFMAVGAFTAATAAQHHIPLPISLVLAGLAGSAVGLVVGLPAIRLRGLYLALATLALQFIVSALGSRYETWSGQSAGFSVPGASIGPVQLTHGTSFLVFLLIMLILVIVVLRRLYRRAPGRAWLTIKESQMAASVIGISPTKWKLTAFVGSAAVISLSGGLLAYYTLNVSSESFTLNYAITFVVMVIVGGLGSIGGVILGAVLVTISPYVLSAITDALPSDMPGTAWLSDNVYFINTGLYGILVLIFLLYQPRGIAGAIDDARSWLIKKLDGPTEQLVASTLRTDRPDTESQEQPSSARAEPNDRAPDPRSARRIRVPPVGPAPSGDVVLRAEGLTVVYRNGARAVDGIDMEVRQGEVVALLGRNGAGKTSTLRALSGFFVSEGVQVGGRITFSGKVIRLTSPVTTSRLGLVLVPERDKVFPNLTVGEHLRLVNPPKDTLDDVIEMFPPLRTRHSSPAGLLSGGERQMLALGVAFCMRPKLLMIDELSLGLAPAVIKRIIAAVRDYQSRTEVPVLLVEQNVGAALELADRVYALDAGHIELSGAAADISRETLISTSLGG